MTPVGRSEGTNEQVCWNISIVVQLKRPEHVGNRARFLEYNNEVPLGTLGRLALVLLTQTWLGAGKNMSILAPSPMFSHDNDSYANAVYVPAITGTKIEWAKFSEVDILGPHSPRGSRVGLVCALRELNVLRGFMASSLSVFGTVLQ